MFVNPKMAFQYFSVLYILLANIVIPKVVQSFPTEINESEEDGFPSLAEMSNFKLEEHPNSAENYMLTTEQQVSCETNNADQDLTRNGITSPERRWEVFKYFISEDFSRNHRRNVRIAVEILRHAVPCLKFEELTSRPSETEPSVTVDYSTDCKTKIGNLGWRYSINLSPTCIKDFATLLHEFIHALGITHEQNRPDRDEYVTINWDNIKPDYHLQYSLFPEPEYSTYGIPYNKKSVMHYSLTAFSSNGNPTMTFKNSDKFAPDVPLSFGPFQHIGLQQSDVDKLRKMYKC